PHIVKILLAEIGEEPSEDFIIKLDYDGSLARSEIDSKDHFDVLAGTPEAQQAMLDYLVEHNGNPKRSLEDALKLAAQTWAVGMDTAEQNAGKSDEETEKREVDTEKVLKEHLKSRHVEAAVLERSGPPSRKFRLLDEKEIRGALKDL